MNCEVLKHGDRSVIWWVEHCENISIISLELHFYVYNLQNRKHTGLYLML